MKQLLTFIFLLAVYHSTGQQKIFTEAEFIAAVKKYHPIARQAEVDVKIAAAEVTVSRGAFDPVLSMSDAGKEIQSELYYRQRDVQLKIPTWYGVDVYAGSENVTGNRINPEETKGTLSYVGFSVPLQSLVMDKRRSALQQARILRQMSEVERQSAMNNLLKDALQTYWDWWEKHHSFQLIQTAVQNAEKRFMMLKTSFKLGERPAIDTIEALTQLQTFLIKQNETYVDLQKSKLELSGFLWVENERQYDLPEDVQPQQTSMSSFVSLDSFLSSATSHPDIVQYSYRLNALAIERRLKWQSLLPSVQAKYQQTNANFLKAVKGEWFQNNYRYGISVSIPLRLSEARGEYTKAKLKLQRTRLEQTNKTVLISQKIKQLYVQWQQMQIQLQLQQAIVENTFTLQRAEETRFSNGESSLFLINSRELKTIEAREKLITLQSKSAIAVIDLRWAAGVLAN